MTAAGTDGFNVQDQPVGGVAAATNARVTTPQQIYAKLWYEGRQIQMLHAFIAAWKSTLVIDTPADTSFYVGTRKARSGLRWTYSTSLFHHSNCPLELADQDQIFHRTLPRRHCHQDLSNASRCPSLSLCQPRSRTKSWR